MRWLFLAVFLLGCSLVPFEQAPKPANYVVYCEGGPTDWIEPYLETAVWTHDRLERTGKVCEVLDMAAMNPEYRLVGPMRMARAREHWRYKECDESR